MANGNATQANGVVVSSSGNVPTNNGVGSAGTKGVTPKKGAVIPIPGNVKMGTK